MDQGTGIGFMAIFIILFAVVVAAVVGVIWYFVSGSGGNQDE